MSSSATLPPPSSGDRQPKGWRRPTNRCAPYRLLFSSVAFLRHPPVAAPLPAGAGWAKPEGVLVSRRAVVLLSTVALVSSLSLWQPSFASSVGSGAHPGAAGGSELSTTTRLADRREVAAGTRAYSIGFEDGRFYANGWHITGEMGGIWTPPVKLLEGVWFGLDGQWVGPATTFTSGWGYTHYTLPV